MNNIFLLIHNNIFTELGLYNQLYKYFPQSTSDIINNNISIYETYRDALKAIIFSENITTTQYVENLTFIEKERCRYIINLTTFSDHGRGVYRGGGDFGHYITLYPVTYTKPIKVKFRIIIEHETRHEIIIYDKNFILNSKNKMVLYSDIIPFISLYYSSCIAEIIFEDKIDFRLSINYILCDGIRNKLHQNFLVFNEKYVAQCGFVGIRQSIITEYVFEEVIPRIKKDSELVEVIPGIKIDASIYDVTLTSGMNSVKVTYKS